MKLKRGDIVTAAFPGDLKKPTCGHPAGGRIDSHTTVLACPFSTFLADAPYFRPTIDPSLDNGLEARLQIMVDKTTPARKEAIRQVIGRLSDEDMARLEAALINITGLRQMILPVRLKD